MMMSEETKEDKIEQETPSVDENTDEKQETEAVQEENKNDQTEEKPNKKTSKRIASAVAEILLYVMIAVVCIFLIPKYVVQRTEVSGESMERTLQNKDNILVEKLSYRFGNPQRFDIIVFRHYYKEDADIEVLQKEWDTEKIEKNLDYDEVENKLDLKKKSEVKAMVETVGDVMKEESDVDITSIEQALQLSEDDTIELLNEIYATVREPSYDFYVKRIIGLPGETVQIVDDTIYINGEPLEENYGKDPIRNPGVAAEPFTLDDDEYFVLGDNREVSQDSRYEEVGNIKRDKIVGKAWLRIYPISKFGFLKH